ncbi:5305_t:CDS:10 [Acaulospora morrowiae]|uniref:5305_t:CDS:1 n=1 Tax=Acaulospora morrowiae TaxID=94023 RepID=A0A9N8YVD8_9GLOM|nr:5305_t:CDS:10 [Acaulospora morrowiae]
MFIPKGFVSLGSADKSIIKWQKGRRIQTMSGHTDCVRALAFLPNTGFASCGNDSTIRIWSLEGQCVRELNGHTSFVYSLDVLPTGEIISSGEDRSVRVWRSGECTQTILHPATSVWCVGAMPNGDIVSGSSDGLIRVFTRDSERVAEQMVLKEFENQVSSHAIPANQIGDLKKDQLPGPEALDVPGKKEGQVIMIRVRDTVEAHQWSQNDSSWHKVGEVVDAVGQGRKQLYNGKEYDYVFDVDIGDGVPPLKLPYNATDNPYHAAQEFIRINELPPSYLDQIVDFITKNSQGVSLGAESQFFDPFTGSSRYTPGGSTNNPRSYSSPSTVPANNNAMTGIDPWTRPSPSQSTSASPKIIPQRTYLTFRQANYQAILNKINQLNKELQGSDPANDNVLTSKELIALEHLIKFLQNQRSSSTAELQSEFTVVHKIVGCWPSASRFPGIDLLRLLILYSPIPAQYDLDGDIINLLISSSNINSWVEGTPPTKEQETNTMLGLRALANLFDTKEGREVLRRKAETIIELISPILKLSTNKNLRVALVTVFLNFSVEFQTNPNDDAILQIIAIFAETLGSEADSEVLYRSIVTLGTVVSYNQAAKEAADVFNVQNSVKLASTRIAEARINQVVGEFFTTNS